MARTGLKSKALAALAVLLVAPPTTSWAVTCELPLFITTATEPNVLILLDNSGSMNFLVNPPAGFDNYTNYSPSPWSAGNLDISGGLYTKWCSNLGSNVSRTLPAKGFRGEFLNWFYCQYSGDPNDVDLTTRWDVAKDATTQLINGTNGVRFGMMHFNSSNGGYIAEPVGASKADLVADIDGVFPNTWTPLGETAEDALEYFKGNNGSYASPIQETCQKNFFVIVTDGEPTQDLSVSSYLQDYDNDGNDPGTYDSSGSDYLDDVVYYMNQNDMSSTYDGVQNVITYVIGFNVDAGILSDAAANGQGEYINAYNASELVDALETVVADIINQGSSGGAVAVLTTSENDQDRLFRAKFTPGSWEGQLENYELPLNGDPPVWDAGAILNGRNASARNMWTALDTADADTRIDDAIEFTSGNANTTDAGGTHLYEMFGFSSPSLSKGQSLIDYLRGSSVTGKRDRDGWKLGDIVYSSPVVVGPPVRFYHDNDYLTYRYDNRTRARHIYVSANDGALHNFDLNGDEEWAFLPQAALSRLSSYWSTSYCHLYSLDGSPKAADVKIDIDGDLLPEWATVIVAGQRSGGGAYFA
ncbi:MAG: hypothetical protein KC466_10850, partial [Myxococcales bacterium]|nr:hypothetical protein [Myxococcales bacterium]